jgi:hypothetical protein
VSQDFRVGSEIGIQMLWTEISKVGGVVNILFKRGTYVINTMKNLI